MKKLLCVVLGSLLVGCGTYSKKFEDFDMMRTAPNPDWVDAMRRGQDSRPVLVPIPDIPMNPGGSPGGGGGGNNGGGNGNGNNGNGNGGGNNGNGQGNGGGNGTGNEGNGKGPK